MKQKNKNLKRKIQIPIITVFLALAVFAFFLLPTNVSHAQSYAELLVSASCSNIQGWVTWAMACPILTAISWVIYAILVVVSSFFALFGILFDLISSFVLDPNAYNLLPLRQGWIIVRDTANLFFIFVLLTIAIATILRIETFGAKRLLPRLILAALLINFSFILTQYVIFTANLMARFFMPAEPRELSVLFLSALNPGQMFRGTEIDSSNASEARRVVHDRRVRSGEIAADDPFYESLTLGEDRLEGNLASTDTELPTFLTELIVAMMGVILFMVVAAFVMAFAGISLLIRMLILWFLMILSPAAFLLFVVPGLDTYARRWWLELIKQSTFPVVFFFFFGLSLQMIRHVGLRDLVTGGVVSPPSTALISDYTSFTYYIIVLMMMVASIIFAKILGGMSAQIAYRGARKGSRMFVTYTKKTGGRAAKKYAIEAGGAAGRRVQEGQGRVARTLRRTPYVSRMSASMEAAQRREVGKYKQKYRSYSDQALANIDSSPGMRVASEKKAIKEVIKERKKKAEREKILREGNSMEKMRAMNAIEREEAEHTAELALYEREEREARQQQDKKEES